ncbi:aspartate dehydrogenase [Sporosarcina sp. HYO08]|uniref:aspartate dehydrogenase n=1 Tax=Sporosarcina sp. HYO08 TaxID=1759557 RepID=UPI0020A5756C|nr:aspartate dehydrogenase [Sporosarcina sp. HYO08]
MIIGCGNIATYVVNSIVNGETKGIKLHTIVGTPRRTDYLQELSAHANCHWTTDIDSLEWDEIDVMIEAAGQQVVKDHLLTFVKKGKHVLVISIGALVDQDFFQTVYTEAKKSGSQILLPSGAIGGLDAIRNAAMGELRSVELTTKKHPDSLTGAPYIIENGIDMDHLTEDLVLFRGSALEAASAFPENLNVAAALSLAGLGPERTMVNIIASPHIEMNTHEIQATGNFGNLYFRFENKPSPENRKSSYLVNLSVVRTLEDFCRNGGLFYN